MQAGAAIREISPPRPAFLAGFPHVDRISEGIHDPLLASALFLRGSSANLMLIALDLLFLSPAAARDLRRRVSQKTGIPEAGVFISCTHTHSGPHTAAVLEWGPSPVVPGVDADYMAFMADRVVEAAADAAGQNRKADLAWCSAAVEGVGRNRHDPENGPRDPEVGLLAVRDRTTRKLFALSMIYSMHPTVLHEDSRLVSSDFPHYTREWLKARLGEGLVVLYHNGPEGDQSPRYDVAANTFDEAKRIGDRLGQVVSDRLGGLKDKDYTADPIVGARLAPVDLPRRVLPPVEESTASLARFRETFEALKRNGAPRGPVRTAECDVFGAEETVYLAQCQADGTLAATLAAYTPLEVQAIRIADACLVGFPGELFVEFGLELKRRAGRTCFPVALVNGEVQGYIVTREAVEKGCYESNNRVFEPEAGTVLVDAALGLMRGL
jgi:hypothetical protein